MSSANNNVERISNRIFISYSHKDKRWLELFETHLKPYVRKEDLQVWSDTRIKTGQFWKEEIEEELALAGIALLLVSPDFMASDFISNEELPSIFEAAKSQGLVIYWIPVKPSAYETTFLESIQSRPSPNAALSLMTAPLRDVTIVSICRELAQIAKRDNSGPQ